MSARRYLLFSHLLFNYYCFDINNINLSTNLEQTLEVLKLKVEAQFKMLSLAEKENDEILPSKKGTEVERHRKRVEEFKNAKLNKLKNAIQVEMVGGDEESENLEEW